MSLSALKQALAKHGLLGSSIIPSKSFEPRIFVHVAYPRDATGFKVEPGATLPIDATQEQPAISFEAEDEGKERFTLALLDPDAPSRKEPKWGPFRHWLVSDLNTGPAPPPGTGPHRYAFLLYRQPADSSPKFFGDKEDRRHYDLKRFVEENNLTLVGANFFLAENKKKEYRRAVR